MWTTWKSIPNALFAWVKKYTTQVWQRSPYEHELLPSNSFAALGHQRAALGVREWTRKGEEPQRYKCTCPAAHHGLKNTASTTLTRVRKLQRAAWTVFVFVSLPGFQGAVESYPSIRYPYISYTTSFGRAGLGWGASRGDPGELDPTRPVWHASAAPSSVGLAETLELRREILNCQGCCCCRVFLGYWIRPLFLHAQRRPALISMSHVFIFFS